MSDLEQDAYVYPGQRIARNGAVLGHGQGMTLRDAFAMHAPWLSSEELIGTVPGYPTFDNSGYFGGFPSQEIYARQLDEQKEWLREARIKWRWQYADAMIAARQGGEQ